MGDANWAGYSFLFRKRILLHHFYSAQHGSNPSQLQYLAPLNSSDYVIAFLGKVIFEHLKKSLIIFNDKGLVISYGFVPYRQYKSNYTGH